MMETAGFSCPAVDPERFQAAVIKALIAAGMPGQGNLRVRLGDGAELEINSSFAVARMGEVFGRAFEARSEDEMAAGTWRLVGLYHLLRTLTFAGDISADLVQQSSNGVRVSQYLIRAAAQAPMVREGEFDLKALEDFGRGGALGGHLNAVDVN